MKKINCLTIIALLTLFKQLTFAQSNQTESLTITTYYPSPYGVYRNLEVRRGLAIGDITKGPVGHMDNLKPGQLYINNSVVLNTLDNTPADPNGTAGQVIYVGGTDKMLKYHDGNKWINATLTPPPCPTGQSCKAPNTCDTPGYACRIPNTCDTPGYTCMSPGSTYVTTVFGSAGCCQSTQVCTPGCPPPDPTSCPPGSHSVEGRGYHTGKNPPFEFYDFFKVCVKN